MMNCGGSNDPYTCASQAEAMAECNAASMRLCSKEEIERESVTRCAFMWTSSSPTNGYYVSDGSDINGCVNSLLILVHIFTFLGRRWLAN